MEARDERRLRSLQKHLASVKLLILDELGYVPFTAVGGELLFEVLSQRYERGSTLITSNLPFDEWTSVFGSERLTGALLDRLTHHVPPRDEGISFRRPAPHRRKDNRPPNDLPKFGHRQREIGFRSASRTPRLIYSPTSRRWDGNTSI
jgi:hypothetical protein